MPETPPLQNGLYDFWHACQKYFGNLLAQIALNGNHFTCAVIQINEWWVIMIYLSQHNAAIQKSSAYANVTRKEICHVHTYRHTYRHTHTLILCHVLGSQVHTACHLAQVHLVLTTAPKSPTLSDINKHSTNMGVSGSLVCLLVGCWRLTSWHHLMSYQVVYPPLVVVHIHGQLYSVAPLEDRDTSTMTCYSTQSHYPNTEPPSHFPILIMLKAWLGSKKSLV